MDRVPESWLFISYRTIPLRVTSSEYPLVSIPRSNLHLDRTINPTQTVSMMMPYFHTDGGDNLLFESWVPSSPRAIAGASFAVFFLAILERFVNGLRGRLQGYWASNALHRSTEHAIREDNTSNKSESASSSRRCGLTPTPRKRIVPPFILAHDFTRGIIYMFQAAIAYALMLAVMTFQVWYFVSIVLGLGVGELLFGRWASVGSYH